MQMESRDYAAKRKQELLEATSELLRGYGPTLDRVREIHGILCEFNLDRAEDFLAFKLVDSESDHLPSGKVRSQWDSDSLREKDQEAGEIEEFYRTQITVAAAKLNSFLKSTDLQAPDVNGTGNKKTKAARSQSVNGWAIWTICVFVILLIHFFLRSKS